MSGLIRRKLIRGLSTMDTIKRCSKCHRLLEYNTTNFCRAKREKSGLRTQCKECDKRYREKNKERIKAWREENKELLKQKEKEYKLKNKDNIVKKSKIYYEGHKKEIIEKTKAWQNKNKEHKQSYDNEYRAKNRDEILLKGRKYREKNRDALANKRKERYVENKDVLLERHKKWKTDSRVSYLRSKHMSRKKRRTTNKGLPATLTAAQWETIKTAFNEKCAYCGKVRELEQDHFVALSNGGEYTHNNIVPACKSCNSSKGNKDFFEWYPKQKFYSKRREQKILRFLNYKNGRQQLALIIKEGT